MRCDPRHSAPRRRPACQVAWHLDEGERRVGGLEAGALAQVGGGADVLQGTIDTGALDQDGEVADELGDDEVGVPGQLGGTRRADHPCPDLARGAASRELWVAGSGLRVLYSESGSDYDETRTLAPILSWSRPG